ncbi:hypothetical protein [Paraburkholderia sp.]|uniref:hypothetical protein n=1 Tax=Paraburkholderia sp. TaxID=1926495 RepID=UPI00238FFF48|nr:hypothetical protein [Paraburkholderia sp.]MDE1183011.1 hypothetical protein [Paraburkholderia sp.]
MTTPLASSSASFSSLSEPPASSDATASSTAAPAAWPAAHTDPFDALPNPRGGSVPAAERALADAQSAFEHRGEAGVPLLRAAQALRDAGWTGAQRFADALALVSPMAAADPASEPGARALFGIALDDFRAALSRRNLRELSCSPSLFAHYQALCAHIARHAPGLTTAYEDHALAARPIPPATLRGQAPERLAYLRASYERALLPVLRAHSAAGASGAKGAKDAQRANGMNGTNGATASADAITNAETNAATSAATHRAYDALDACLAELASDDPYDYWRLAATCARSLRASGHLSGEADVRRFYARCNLVLADHARGLALAPRSLVRATLALLWRDYALYGASAEDVDAADVLRDYGLTVDWHVAATQDSEALWEAGMQDARARSETSRSVFTREIGGLFVNSGAYEDFLQTADASIVALAVHAQAANSPEKADPSEALLAGEAAYRLGAAAWALGLGRVALLADALGLAWRRRAHAEVATLAVRAHVVVEAPDPAALEQAAEALRAMLHTVAAGVAPADGSVAMATLTRAIQQGGA